LRALGGGAAVAGVDEHRLARRRDEQRRVAAFDVHDVDVERPARSLRARLRRHDREAGEKSE